MNKYLHLLDKVASEANMKDLKGVKAARKSRENFIWKNLKTDF